MAQLKNNTVSVTNNSATVTGIGTTWLGNVPGNSYFIISDENAGVAEGQVFTISAATDDTTLSLTAPWTGPTGTFNAVIHIDFLPNGVPSLVTGDLETVPIIDRAHVILSNKTADATTTTAGVVEKATTAEAQAGTEADKFPDVVGVKAHIDARIATSQEVKDGSDSTVLVTPDNLTAVVPFDVDVEPALSAEFGKKYTLYEGREYVDKTFSQLFNGFTRASEEAYYGPDGRIKTATSGEPAFAHDPVTGELLGLQSYESRTNLLQHSNNLSSSAWVKQSLHVESTYNLLPPIDGTSVFKIVEDLTLNDRFFNQNVSVVSGEWYTFSVIARAGTHTKIQIAGSTGFSTDYMNFDLISGDTAGTGSVYSMEKAGDWYIASLTLQAVSTTTGRMVCAFIEDLSDGRLPDYTGAGNYFYVTGVEMQDGPFPTPYIPTPVTFISRASSGSYFDSSGTLQTASTDVAREDYAYIDGRWVSRGLLVEDNATNFIRYSADSSQWTVFSATLNTNTDTAPDGTSTADTFTNTSDSGGLYKAEVVSSASSTYTLSCFYKKGASGGTARLLVRENLSSSNTAYANFDLTTGEASGQVSGGTFAIVGAGAVDYGDYWRIYLVATISTDTSIRAYCYSNANNGNSFTVWGAQLEEGYYPTSYIETTASQVTRAADIVSSSQVTRVADRTTITDVIDTTRPFTIIANGCSLLEGNRPTVFELIKDTGNRIIVSKNASVSSTGTAYRVYIAVNGVIENHTFESDSTDFALVYDTQKIEIISNGVVRVTVTTPGLINLNYMPNLHVLTGLSDISAANGTMRALKAYSKALTSDELIKLTKV